MGRARGSVAPDSRRARLRRLLRARPPLSFAEIRRVYREAYPSDTATHDSLTSAVGALINDGTLVRAGDCDGDTLYVHRTAPAPSTVGDDEALAAAIVDIVESHYREEQCPIATVAIGAALRARGLWPDRFGALYARLRMLARAPGDGGDAAGAPSIRRVEARGLPGARSAFWVPAWAPEQCALTPPSRAAALRWAIAAATTELGRPASKREIRWWLDAQPARSLVRGALDPARLGPDLQHTTERDERRYDEGDARRDGRRTGEDVRLYLVRGPLTCHGGAPPRYSLGAADERALAACRLEDALLALRPAEELAQLDALHEAIRWSDSDVLAEVSRARQAILRRALGEYAGSHDPRATLEQVRVGHEALARWIEGATLAAASAHDRRRLVARAQADLAAAACASTCGRDSPSVAAAGDTPHETRYASLRYVGRAGLVGVDVLRRAVERAIDRGEIATPSPHAVYAAARRFPNPASAARPAADELALLDRVDAVGALARAATSSSAARSLLDGAVLALGNVLRDAAYVRALLEHFLWGDAPARRALVVALGLLGERSDLVHAMPLRTDADGAAAYVLAVALAELCATRALPHVRELEAWARGPARDLASRAAARLADGRLFDVLD